MSQKITVSEIQSFKTQGKKISVLTAYDYPFAKILDDAGIDMILVGDSLANVVLGLESTRDIGIAEMLHHARAVGRGVQRACVVGDMPFSSYQVQGANCIGDAKKFIVAGCDAVKVEWFDGCLDVVRQLRCEHIAVMGHIGLTPQTADQLGGFKVQGRSAQKAKDLYDQAFALQEAGCFAIVFECVPDRVAKVMTEKLHIPTIGIGAGPYCDGQVLVVHDVLGLSERKALKFVKEFVDLKPKIQEAAQAYREHIAKDIFPSQAESFAIDDAEFRSFLDLII